MGAIGTGWGPRHSALLEQYIEGFNVVYADGLIALTDSSYGWSARASRFAQVIHRIVEAAVTSKHGPKAYATRAPY